MSSQHLQQRESQHCVMISPQVGRQLVCPGQAQHQVGDHEVIVKRPLKEQLAAEDRLWDAACALSCAITDLSHFISGSVLTLKNQHAISCGTNAYAPLVTTPDNTGSASGIALRQCSLSLC